MTFSSLSFLLVFFPVVFLLYWGIPARGWRNGLLIAASLVFYAFGEPVTVFLMILSVLGNYLFGLVCAGNRFRKLMLVGAVVLNIGMLMAFKYTGFLVETVNAVAHLSLPVPVIRLPIGISFFTFQGLSYVVDVYRDRRTVQKNPFTLLLYISFFPQLIAGPIVQYHDIESQLTQREFTAKRVAQGLNRFILGLSKKVLIANTLGYVADAAYATSVSDLGTAVAWIGAITYLFQIYYDFSGYSDMAIGMGAVFGFDFKENFRYPYSAVSIQDFWRRWHISLSTWFREYVYIPLGGNRRGKVRADVNRIIVFFLTGLWHGANLTFIVWGMVHGMFLMLENHGIVPVNKPWFRPFRRIYTLLVVTLSMVLFRADTLGQAAGVIGRMFVPAAGDSAVTATLLGEISPLFVISLLAAVLFAVPTIPWLKERFSAGGAVQVQVTAYVITLLLLMLCLLFLLSGRYNPFIYFRF